MSVPIMIDHVCKKFGEHTVIPDLTVNIKNGEFFTLLGPSGCGKTTLLRMIAGFNSIEAGSVSFGEQVVNDVPTYQRNIGMVFQSYAIFPHLTVRKNVEYGLKIRKIPKAEMKTRVDEILKLVHIDELQDRLPERLSGGQQQRVALARAIVIHPQVLLMDEPLSNLDAKLRIEMRAVIREIQKQVGITTVYVTHDQEEALAISDRIAVMNQGVIQQIGAPYTIYARPVNVFAATFIGHSNLFWATAEKNGQTASVVFSNGYKAAMNNMSDSVQDGQTVVVAVRPEEFTPADEGLTCRIVNRTFLGRYSNYFLKFDETLCVPGQPSLEFSQDLGHSEKLFDVGDTLTLQLNPQKINVFTQDMDMSLIKDVIHDDNA
jgi:iron(III) transport system ATP-binding protein